MSDLKKALLGLRLAIDDLLAENLPTPTSVGVMVGDVWSLNGIRLTVRSVDLDQTLVTFTDSSIAPMFNMLGNKNGRWQLLCRPQPLPTKHESSKIEDPLSGVMVGDQWAFNQGNPLTIQSVDSKTGKVIFTDYSTGDVSRMVNPITGWKLLSRSGKIETPKLPAATTPPFSPIKEVKVGDVWQLDGDPCYTVARINEDRAEFVEGGFDWVRKLQEGLAPWQEVFPKNSPCYQLVGRPHEKIPVYLVGSINEEGYFLVARMYIDKTAAITYCDSKVNGSYEWGVKQANANNDFFGWDTVHRTPKKA